MLLIISSVLIYIGIGTMYARWVVKSSVSTAPKPVFTVLDDNSHPSNCNLNNSYTRNSVCNCDLKYARTRAVKMLSRWELGQEPLTNKEVYWNMAMWPLIIHHQLMKPPVGRESRRERRMRHELENAEHIAKITAITQGNQSAINESLNPLDIKDTVDV